MTRGMTREQLRALGFSNKDINRGLVLGSAALQKIAGTSLDSGPELDALMKLPEAMRDEIIDRARAGEHVSAITGGRPQ